MASQQEMLNALADHHKVEKGTKTFSQLWKEMKKKTGKERIQDMYDALPASAKIKEPEKPKLAVVEAVAQKPKDGEIIPPGRTDLRIDGAQQNVDVKAPSLAFHLAPSSVTVNPGDVSWAYTFQRAVMYGFVFASGFSFGVLMVILTVKGI